MIALAASTIARHAQYSKCKHTVMLTSSDQVVRHNEQAESQSLFRHFSFKQVRKYASKHTNQVNRLFFPYPLGSKVDHLHKREPLESYPACPDGTTERRLTTQRAEPKVIIPRSALTADRS